MEVDELIKLGIDERYINAWRAKGFKTLTEIQEKAFTNASLRSGKNILVIAPTSSGKTFVGEVLAVKAARELKRVLYLVPYKALAEEKFQDFTEVYGPLGISVVVSSGDRREFDDDIRRGNFGIGITIYEKLAQFLVQSPGVIGYCQLLIVDEIQLIRTPDRGPLLEMLLTRIKRMPTRPQLIFLSATVGMLNNFDKWLGLEIISSMSRPIPLQEYVCDYKGNLLNWDFRENKYNESKITLVNAANIDELLIKISLKLPIGEQMLIFRAQVDETERTAQALAESLPSVPLSQETIQSVRDLEESPARDFLERNLYRGVAYHNAGLALEERRLIESLFRHGEIRVLMSTTTLAAGVNLPADKVVVADVKRWDPELRTLVPIEVSEYKNCAGRAGRYGQRKSGESFLLARDRGEAELLLNKYILGQLESLESAIPKEPDFAKHVLGVIASGLASTEVEIVELFIDSFAQLTFYSQYGDQKAVGEGIKNAINILHKAGLIEKDATLGIEKVTPLGRIAALSGISVDTFSRLVKLIQRSDLSSMSLEDIFLELENCRELSRLAPYLSGQKSKLLALWISGEEVRNITREFRIGYGRIRDLGESAEWLLTIAVDIAKLTGIEQSIINKMSRLTMEAHYGVPYEVVPVAQLRVLKRSEIIHLVKNDMGKSFTSLHQILDTDPAGFIGILDPNRVSVLKYAIAKNIGNSFQRKRTGHVIRSEKISIIRTLIVNLYDNKGLDFERAIEDLLNVHQISLDARRFTRQRTREPDIQLPGNKGTIIISASASEDFEKPISWNKAKEVLGSVGFTGQASNYITVGKPDFHDLAIKNVHEVTERGEKLLLLRVDVLAELCLNVIEGKLKREDLLDFLENKRGYISSQEDDMLKFYI